MGKVLRHTYDSRNNLGCYCRYRNVFTLRIRHSFTVHHEIQIPRRAVYHRAARRIFPEKIILIRPRRNTYADRHSGEAMPLRRYRAPAARRRAFGRLHAEAEEDF